MKISEAVNFGELYNNEVFIPKTTGIIEATFMRITLIAWNDLNLLTQNQIANIKEEHFSDFEKDMIKGFIYSFIEGYMLIEDELNIGIGVSKGGGSLGDYSSGTKEMKGINPSNYMTFPFYSTAKSFILRTQYLSTVMNDVLTNRKNQFIGNF